MNPAAAIARYLAVVYEESVRRGYHFDLSKITAGLHRGHRQGGALRIKITETKGQLLYEWEHLKAKLAGRDRARHRTSQSVSVPEHHPLFRIVKGDVREWERVKIKGKR